MDLVILGARSDSTGNALGGAGSSAGAGSFRISGSTDMLLPEEGENEEAAADCGVDGGGDAGRGLSVRGNLIASGVQHRRRLAIIMVGLPARGKTFTAQKLARYLNWLGHHTRHFNVGRYRRDFTGSAARADFFDPGNAEAVATRNEVARMALDDMLDWLACGDGQVGIYGARAAAPRVRRSAVALRAQPPARRPQTPPTPPFRAAA